CYGASECGATKCLKAFTIAALLIQRGVSLFYQLFL
ncbi:hypothetical protein HPHPP25C_0220, partial [Helicobacter pylori Hp P-25c]